MTTCPHYDEYDCEELERYNDHFAESSAHNVYHDLHVEHVLGDRHVNARRHSKDETTQSIYSMWKIRTPKSKRFCQKREVCHSKLLSDCH